MGNIRYGQDGHTVIVPEVLQVVAKHCQQPQYYLHLLTSALGHKQHKTRRASWKRKWGLTGTIPAPFLGNEELNYQSLKREKRTQPWGPLPQEAEGALCSCEPYPRLLLLQSSPVPSQHWGKRLGWGHHCQPLCYPSGTMRTTVTFLGPAYRGDLWIT